MPEMPEAPGVYATEAELDATVAAARRTTEASNKLLDDARKARGDFAAWRAQLGLDDAKMANFMASLPPDQQARAKAEREAFERETIHDLQAAEARHAAQTAAPAAAKPARRPRNMA